MWVFWMWFWPNMMPLLASQKPFVEFARELQTKIPEKYHPYLVNIGSQDSRIIWYSDMRIPRIIDPYELLEKQEGERSLQREMRIVAEEMIEQLRADDPVLMVIDRPHYVRFLIEGREELIKEGREFPETHLWLESEFGPKYEHFVVFGNIQPPWEEPVLDPPSMRLQEALSGEETRPTTQAVPPPGTQPEA
jgi:hypothetical protein